MYYSFYMNERMLLDEWKYYQRKGECNWLLKRTLMNDNTRTPEEKIKFYKENRRVVNHMCFTEFFQQQADRVYWKCFETYRDYDTKAEAEYALENMFINDGYEVMDYGHKQRLFNMYRRYNEFAPRANALVEKHLSFEPIKSAKFREHKFIMMYRSDIKFIRNARKNVSLTVPQIEVLFGIIFFCRMHETKNAQLNSGFKKKQFMGCFDNATLEDLEYVISNVPRLEKTEDDDVIYHGFYDWEIKDKHGEWIGTSDSIWIKVTKQNNKLNLTKMAHKYITDIDKKRYCEMCFKPFVPTNNRQKVCERCKPRADEIKAKLRKTKQRYIQKHGKDACCGKCTDCIKTDCNNWWEYWGDELSNRDDYSKPIEYVLEQLLYDIEHAYTDEEKSKIVPREMTEEYKKYNVYI